MNTFNWHDASVNIWQEHADPSDRATFDAVIRLLRREGFRVILDPEQVGRYGRKWATSYRVGKKGDLQCHLNIFGRHIEVGFFQELVKDNPNGGRYDFDKLEKMPYLIRLAFLNVRRKLTPMLVERGYADATKVRPRDAMAAVEQRRAETEAFHRGIYAKRPDSYSRDDADGLELKDGEIRYFRTHKGHLARGRVFYNLNNMWWVVVNRDEWTNVANFHLFAYRPGMPVRLPPNPKGSVERRLKRCVEAMDFERAIPLRDWLRKLEAAA